MVSLATPSRSPATAARPTNPSKMRLPSSPVSILKRSKTDTTTPGLKHRMEEMDLSLSPPSNSPSPDSTPSPRKRPRVQFADLRRATYDGQQSRTPEKSAALVREEVRRAIQRHVSDGGSEAYDRIKEVFTADPRKHDDGIDIPTHTSLKNHLLGLLSNVAALDRSCNGLVTAVLDSQWLGRDESYVKLYIRFLGNLAAAQGVHLGSVLRMLVKYLRELPRGTGRLPGYARVHAKELYPRVHMALRYVIGLIPSGSGALSPILSSEFPSPVDSAKANVAYTHNLLRVIGYAPELQADILALITEKLVKIDVQIQVDLEDLKDEEEEGVLQDVSPEEIMYAEGDDEDDEDEDDDNDSVLSEGLLDSEAQHIKTIKDNTLKLDGMIDSLFEYYNPPFTTGTLDDKKSALDTLINHFESIILPTYKSRHTQFILFHFSQFHPDLVDQFTGMCIELIFEMKKPVITRQSATAYLASFVARGAHVSGDVVRDVFEMLGMHLEDLRTDYEATCRGPDLRRYGSFYSAVQALLYIFCFRWRDLTTAAMEGESVDQVDEMDPDDITFPPMVKEVLHQAIHSKLNPLKVCSPPIVSQFARMSQHLNLMYVFSILETNKRVRMSSYRNLSALADPRFAQIERETRAGEELGNQLDAYFPFDPYQLPHSSRWVKDDYVEWRGIPGLDDQEDSDSEANGSESEDDMSEGTGTDEE
ncbi:rDNA-binding RNA polymerase I transcriptional factor [Aspergillus affinis]|uniref:rDNA-binding RNA polymerase I transcriptional factor n=1 Tax=Aspergillus affinis TaxID=1070780 RepID=UPI0022FE232D|nr:RNA polymerase I-specific transcription initiation factor RRN3 superfamily [Aspergillus affinis]KAI9043791.1 RNA polymerase I-specific transcription initiation factor RRN3 superfamily [Aspergillus affinis]